MSVVVIDVQFSPANNDWPVLRDATLAAEAAGFGAAWVYDHLAGRSLGGSRNLEAFTLLGALAATTTSIGLGPMVANVASRQPGVLAVGIASLAAIADRRVFLGVGAGSSPNGRWAAEMHTVRHPVEPSVARRHQAVERLLDVVDEMWSADRGADWDTFLLPRPRPPVIVGTSSVALAQLAGRRADGVNVAWSHPRRDELLATASDAYARSGRDGEFVLTTWTRWDDALLDAEHTSRRAMADLGIGRLVLAELGPVRPDHIANLRPDGGNPVV
jgi:alkanesulfonate monooxygenase SsuD/methylene tetrahydromethanopterin reductase-like flavin-dependent oxidoreductase (luciferase family)